MASILGGGIIIAVLLLLFPDIGFGLRDEIKTLKLEHTKLQQEINVLKNRTHNEAIEFNNKINESNIHIDVKSNTINNLKKENSRLEYILKKYNITYKVNDKKYKSNSLINKVFDEN